MTSTSPAITWNGTGPDTPDSIEPLAAPLAAFVPDHSQASSGSAAVVTADDRVVVVLRADRNEAGVQVHDPVRSVHTLPTETPATPISDERIRAEFLAAAASDLAGIHALDQTQLAAAETRHQRVLADIREYVIERCVAGDLCRDGINRFFQAFALPTYDPRIRVSYTLTGSYDVDTDNPDAAARDARGYLKPDLSELDAVIDASDTHTVHISQVTEIDT